MTDMLIVPGIVAIVYALMEVYKQLIKKEEKYMKYIPIISSVLGIILAVIGFFLVPSIVPTNNLFSAILIGIASGLSATGTHQIFKQLK